MNQSKSILAVCDLEVEYAYNFMEYLNQKKSVPFEVQAFTTVDALSVYAREHPIEILLISSKTMCDAVKELNIKTVMILTEGIHNPKLDQYPSIYKYQSSDNVIREVMNCYGSEQTVRPQTTILKQRTKVIGIYSPIGRVQKTSLALTMGQIFAKNHKVLYLNLESFSGFEQLLGQCYEQTLSDLLYYIRQENNNLIYKMGGMVQSMQNLDFIPPASSPMDIQSTTYDEWIRLFDMIVHESSYEILILDLSDCIQELFRVLGYCDRIYLPIRTDIISSAKITQFEQQLTIWGFSRLLETIRKIRLPFHTTNRTGTSYFEELIWSELGDFVRELIRKEDFT